MQPDGGIHVKSPQARLKLALNTAISALLAFGLLWPFHFAVNARFWEHLMDAVHPPLFFGIACWLDWAWGPAATSGKRPAKAMIAAAAIAGATELIQPFTGRSASWLDFLNGTLGAVAGAWALRVWQGNQPRLRLIGPVILLAATTGMSLWPGGLEWQAMQWRQRHFPLLGDFEGPVELRLWEAQGGSAGLATEIHLATNHVNHGTQALQISTGAGSWAGVSYAAGGEDWSRPAGLIAEVYNPGEPFSLGVRVDDDGDCTRYGRRFDRECLIIPGWNRVQISTADLERGPADRRLNLRSIRRLVFFTGADQPARTFFLDYVRLE